MGDMSTLRLADYSKAIELCKDDPVRPHLPDGWRVEEGSREAVSYTHLRAHET